MVPKPRRRVSYRDGKKKHFGAVSPDPPLIESHVPREPGDRRNFRNKNITPHGTVRLQANVISRMRPAHSPLGVTYETEYRDQSRGPMVPVRLGEFKDRRTKDRRAVDERTAKEPRRQNRTEGINDRRRNK